MPAAITFGSGAVLRLARPASVQFVTPILFRVIRLLDWSTYDGWEWLDGYQLSRNGDDAIRRRSVFVRLAGVTVLTAAAP